MVLTGARRGGFLNLAENCQNGSAVPKASIRCKLLMAERGDSNLASSEPLLLPTTFDVGPCIYEELR